MIYHFNFSENLRVLLTHLNKKSTFRISVIKEVANQYIPKRNANLENWFNMPSTMRLGKPLALSI